MVRNSHNFCLSAKLLISPSILNEILARYCNLDYRFFPFNTLNISCHSLLACRVSAERSAVKCMGFPLYFTSFFPLAAFHILSLCLFFVSLVSMCLGMFLLGLVLYRTLCLLYLIAYFLFHVGEIFKYSLFKNFLIPFLFLFFIWDSYNLAVGAFDVVPEFPETVLSSFNYFHLILLFRSCFHHFIFQLTDSFLCFRYSVCFLLWEFCVLLYFP